MVVVRVFDTGIDHGHARLEHGGDTAQRLLRQRIETGEADIGRVVVVFDRDPVEILDDEISGDAGNRRRHELVDEEPHEPRIAPALVG